MEFRHSKLFLIRAINEQDDGGSPLYWSNDDGWVDKESATAFVSAETAFLNLPIGGAWEPWEPV